LLLKENVKFIKNDKFNDALSIFFRNVDVKNNQPLSVDSKISSLKARVKLIIIIKNCIQINIKQAIIVDMEEGVINRI